MIHPPNKMLHKVTLGGRIRDAAPDDNLLAAAEQQVADDLQAFDQELDKAVEQMVAAGGRLDAAAEDWSAGVADLSAALEIVILHGGRGGYDLLAGLAKILRSFVARVAMDDAAARQVVGAHVNSIRKIYNEQMTGDGGDAGRKLAMGLNKIMMGFLKGRANAKTPGA